MPNFAHHVCLPAKQVLVFSARAATHKNKQLNGLREHISDIFGAVRPRIRRWLRLYFVKREKY